MSKKTIRKPAFLGKYNWKAILPWIFQIAVVLALAAMMSIFFCQSVIMQESSMEPSIETGQHLLMNKVTYKLKEPQRGDVIAFKKERGIQGWHSTEGNRAGTRVQGGSQGLGYLH